MLGSTGDAEDLTQETLLRAWRGLGGFERRSSIRTWLYRIATNACLNALESESRRVLPVDLTQTTDAEVYWIEPYAEDPALRAELRESLELAFVAALQHLPSRQRAALILRDVLAFSAREAAEILQTSTAAVNSAVQHARATVAERVPERSQQATLKALGEERVARLVARYAHALETADLDEMLRLLTEEPTWSMPPSADCVRGSAAVTAFLRDDVLPQGWRHIATTINGQAALGCYMLDDTGRYVATALDVLTIAGERIAAVTAFLDPCLFARFGLPDSLPAETPVMQVA